MKLLYVQEHLTCYNYSKGENSAWDIVDIVEGEKKIYNIQESKILFLIKGSISITFGKYSNRIIKEGHMILLTAGEMCTIDTLSDIKFLIARMGGRGQLCDMFCLESLSREGKEFNYNFNYLKFNICMESFLDLLTNYLEDGLRCVHFLEIKINELMFVLRAYYSKRELFEFFYPILSNDVAFSDFVMKNYLNVRTVKEFASLSNYSLSGFEKRFKKVFGVPAYQWMKQQRAKCIFHDINSTDKSFKEISYQYDFSSPSQFNDFCKANFGLTPGKIRKNK